MRDIFSVPMFFPRNLFACFFPPEISLQDIFFLKTPITPSKVKWLAPKIHQTVGQLINKLSILLHLTYCHLVWHNCRSSDRRRTTERIQEHATFRAGAPSDGFLQNALKTLFRLSRVLLDLKRWFSLVTE